MATLFNLGPYTTIAKEEHPPPLARATDPDTSHQAALSAPTLGQGLNKRIVDYLAHAGLTGGTKDEIAANLGGVNATQVARRFARLERLGWIWRKDVNPGPADRRPSPAGLPCGVYRLTAAAVLEVK